ncbi:MAG: GIDE domain-containing protein [Candidatus Aenigmatarchaeota archaeon]
MREKLKIFFLFFLIVCIIFIVMVAYEGFFFYPLIGLGFGTFLFIEGVSFYKRKRLIEDIPRSKIRSIAMGLVEVYGEVIPAKRMILRSPLTNSTCVYYKLVIKEEKTSGKRRVWVTVKNEEKRTYFYIKDETGLVLVDPNGAEIDVPAKFEFDSYFGKDPPNFVKKYLLANNIEYKDFFGINKNMRFYEYYIAPRNRLFIMGTAGDNPFIKEGWASSGTEDVMIKRGDDEIYYISTRSEREILNSLKWKAIGGIFGGGFLITLCLFVILLYLI